MTIQGSENQEVGGDERFMNDPEFSEKARELLELLIKLTPPRWVPKEHKKSNSPMSDTIYVEKFSGNYLRVPIIQPIRFCTEEECFAIPSMSGYKEYRKTSWPGIYEPTGGS